MIERVSFSSKEYAIIVRSDYSSQGISFFTENEYSQQLAYMCHPTGHEIMPHRHNQFQREVYYTLEVLFIKKGKLRVDFFNEGDQYLDSRVLEAGDVILLVAGGHGFEVLEEVEMFEVKQGPYTGDADKSRFTSNLPPDVIGRLR